MGSRINTNIGALNALKSLNDVGNRLSVAQLRLATGKRINSAGDDAAGYSIAKKFNSRAEGLGQALNNIGSAKNLIAVAEGHLSNIVDILTQMKTKTIQAADDSLGTAERTAIKGELVKLTNQIDLEVNQARWNDKTIFSGSATTGASSASGLFKFQIGAGASTTNDILKFDLLAKANVSFDSAASTKGFSSTGLNV
ncbi:MAG TPA: flagellin, partial [Candidatus Wunengus sp. YC60]|uniref:flagellin n=1 Tax=Candidatus Wunengus sp. YC60 TaxID=3367697 RepID=UPI004029ACDE